MTPSVPITTELEQSMSSFYTDQGQIQKIQKEGADEVVGEAQEPHPPQQWFFGTRIYSSYESPKNDCVGG